MRRARNLTVACLSSAMLVGSAACAKPNAAVTQTPAHRVEKHRPLWLQTAAADVDLMAQCLEPREAPRYVVLVVHTADDFTDVTTVDAFAALQHCVVHAGKVVVRLPSDARLSEDAYAELAVFALGSAPPNVSSGAELEEVMRSGRTLGWLYWPNAPTRKARPQSLERARMAERRRGAL